MSLTQNKSVQTEFDLIRFLAKHNTVNSPYLELGIGDDAAIQHIPANQHLVTSVDTSISGVHFPVETAAEDIGYKSLAVSLSDMAAMGAEPIGVLLTLTIPEINEQWLQAFTQGFFELAKQFKLPLIGGDTTRGALSISTVVQGLIPAGESILRSGAKPGDIIYVSGCLGDAGLALQQWRQQQLTELSLQRALNRPSPRVALGLALREIASSAIDISDGLIQDLNHILMASEVGAEIHLENLPLSDTMRQARSLREAQALALQAGDDYELCFTVDPQFTAKIRSISQTLNVPLTPLGCICVDLGMKVYERGVVVDFKGKGFQHF